MSPRSFSFAITSASSLDRASAVSVALLNSNSSVEARLMIAGFFGAAGAGVTGAAALGVATGAGAGAAAGASGFGAGFCSSVAQPATSAAPQRALKKAFFEFIYTPQFLLGDGADL